MNGVTIAQTAMARVGCIQKVRLTMECDWCTDGEVWNGSCCEECEPFAWGECEKCSGTGFVPEPATE